MNSGTAVVLAVIALVVAGVLWIYSSHFIAITHWGTLVH